MPRYFTTRRPNRHSYYRLLRDLADAGIHENQIPEQLWEFHVASREEWLRVHFPYLFICGRCHKVGLPDEVKHPNKQLCIACGQSVDRKYHEPRFVDLEEEPEEYTARVEAAVADAAMRKELAREEILDIMKGNKHSEPQVSGSAMDILNKAGKVSSPPQVGKNGSPAESPLGVSKVEPATNDNEEKPHE